MNFLAPYLTKGLVYLALVASLYFNYDQSIDAWGIKDERNEAIKDKGKAIEERDKVQESLRLAAKKIGELETKNKLCRLNAEEEKETSLIERIFNNQIKEIFYEQNNTDSNSSSDNHAPRMYF